MDEFICQQHTVQSRTHIANARWQTSVREWQFDRLANRCSLKKNVYVKESQKIDLSVQMYSRWAVSAFYTIVKKIVMWWRLQININLFYVRTTTRLWRRYVWSKVSVKAVDDAVAGR